MFTTDKTRTNRGFGTVACKVVTAGTNAAFHDSTRAETFTRCNNMTIKSPSSSALASPSLPQRSRLHLLALPFIREGRLRALGTRFLVEQLDDATQVTMLESATRIDAGGRSQTLNAGQRLRFDANGPGAVAQVDSQALQNAWDDRQLLAYNQPLTDVLERLARHRKGLVLFDKQALSALRVTVMLPTDDSDRALRLLARTLPIEISHYTPWLTRVTLVTEQKNN